MRYSASEKFEIIRTVDASHLPARRTLAMLDIPENGGDKLVHGSGGISQLRAE